MIKPVVCSACGSDTFTVQAAMKISLTDNGPEFEEWPRPRPGYPETVGEMDATREPIIRCAHCLLRTR